jgi:transposase
VFVWLFDECTGPTTRQVKRIEIMTLWKQGLSQRRIARTVGCSHSAVEECIHKLKEAEAQGIPANVAILDKPRSGAPHKITRAIGKAILKYAEGKCGRQVPAINQYVHNKFGISLDDSSIRKWLTKEGLKPYHRPKRLSLSDSHKVKRVAFAQKYKKQDWMNTLFTDESEFPLHLKATNTKNDVVWARCIEDVPPAEIEQYSKSVRVWGGVSAKGKTRLIFYEGDLTAQKYRDKLLEKVKPDFKTVFGARNRSWTFAHDGASAHKAKLTNEWLEEHVPNHITSGPVGDWPAHSADLNSVIEHAWGYMDGQLEKETRPKTINAMKRRLKKLWDDYDQDAISKQAGGMKKRLKSVISSGGEWMWN